VEALEQSWHARVEHLGNLADAPTSSPLSYRHVARRRFLSIVKQLCARAQVDILPSHPSANHKLRGWQPVLNIHSALTLCCVDNHSANPQDAAATSVDDSISSAFGSHASHCRLNALQLRGCASFPSLAATTTYPEQHHNIGDKTENHGGSSLRRHFRRHDSRWSGNRYTGCSH